MNEARNLAYRHLDEAAFSVCYESQPAPHVQRARQAGWYPAADPSPAVIALRAARLPIVSGLYAS